MYFSWSREKIVVPGDKPFITLSGTEASNTIITWSEGGDITDSPTLTVLASDFVARYLTIQVTIIYLRFNFIRLHFYTIRLF